MSYEIMEIIDKLIGDIYPVGETNEDKKRLENIKLYAEVADIMCWNLRRISNYKDKQAFSERAIGRVADEAIKQIEQAIKDGYGDI